MFTMERKSVRAATASAVALLLVLCVGAFASCIKQDRTAVPRTEVDAISSVTLFDHPTTDIVAPTGADEVDPEAETDAYAEATVTVTFGNDSDMPVAALNDITVTMQDAEGSALAVQRTTTLQSIGAHERRKYRVTFTLSQEQFDSFDEVVVSYFCPTGHSLGFGTKHGLQSIAGLKHEYLLAKDHQAAQEHVRAWKEKYSTADYSDTVLIGDSLMDNARSQLKAELPGVTVNADSGRTLENGGVLRESESPDSGILDHIRRDSGEYERYVIGTGNNDVRGVSMAAAQEMVDCIGPDKQIYFITMIVTGNTSGTATTNASIDAMVEQYSNVHKIDWYELVSGHESEYLADGCHPRKDHIPQYVALIREGLEVVY